MIHINKNRNKEIDLIFKNEKEHLLTLEHIKHNNLSNKLTCIVILSNYFHSYIPSSVTNVSLDIKSNVKINNLPNKVKQLTLSKKAYHKYYIDYEKISNKKSKYSFHTGILHKENKKYKLTVIIHKSHLLKVSTNT